MYARSCPTLQGSQGVMYVTPHVCKSLFAIVSQALGEAVASSDRQEQEDGLMAK